MTKLQQMGLQILPLLLAGSVGGCAWMTSGMQQRFAVCSYDHAWDAAIDAVKDRSADTMDKDAGLIVTEWLEIPMPGRPYGIFRRDVADSKDRSRLTLKVKRVDDVARISFIEERQSWVFRGGSRLFGWAPTDPSDEVMRDIQRRLDAKLQEHGCTVT
ncbi:MAG: hypothetical protein HP496_08870 [Nitrospira sp.]|nr:hypothetical protein [Nitrospira sp.]